MKTKPVTPYARLLEQFKEFCDDVFYRPNPPMFFYPKNNLKDGWNLVDVYERTAAANTLGFDVMLTAKENGLQVTYIKKLPSRPWNV